MKHIKILVLVFLILQITSCKKTYLDLEPKTNYTYYNFPNDEAQMEQLVTGMYRQLIPIYSNYMWVFGEMLSDNSSYRFNPSSTSDNRATLNLDEFTSNSAEVTIDRAYRDFYEGISRSHVVLENIDRITYLSDSVKQSRIGEAKFFRAFYYFNLVRLFGDVPIIKQLLVAPNPNAATQFPRRPVQQVYEEMIIPDALDAIARLPLTVPNSQKGRLVKAAAQMLLGKAYLTLKNYPKALENFNAVTGYSLNPSYVANFNPATKNGVESIFEVQVLPIPAESGGFSFSFMASWAPFGTGTNFWSGIIPVGSSLNQPTDTLYNSYEPADTLLATSRRNVTIKRIFQGTTRILGFTKFAYNQPANPNLCQAQWPVYRFAETQLSKAECLNEISFPNAEAFTLLNVVRTRAGLPSKTQGNANPRFAINTQAEFRLAIENERKFEFAGEAHRWFDLLRTDRVLPVMNAHATAERLVKPYLTPSSYATIKTLVGIPFRETNEFGYPQNPGWE
jgi:starch-binding outer membrane protein, SusD/RagB family